jgi:hypothetical protein
MPGNSDDVATLHPEPDQVIDVVEIRLKGNNE